MNQVMNIYKNVRWQIFIFVVYMEKINWTIENDFQKWIYNLFTLVNFTIQFLIENWKKKKKLKPRKKIYHLKNMNF